MPRAPKTTNLLARSLAAASSARIALRDILRIIDQANREIREVGRGRTEGPALVHGEEVGLAGHEAVDPLR